MTLDSELIAVQSVDNGHTIGYGSTYTAGKPMRIGVVACGYADGYPRIAPEGTPVIVDGIRTKLVGRVSMDMMTVDLTPCPTRGHRLARGIVGREPADRRRRAALRHDRLRADVRGRAARAGAGGMSVGVSRHDRIFNNSRIQDSAWQK